MGQAALEAGDSPATWKVIGAFATIYLVWGSTFLAIRVGVHEVPPLLFAAMRFFTAGVVLCGWTLARRERMPRGREWASITLLALLIFVVDYGFLFWAEQRVPSGIAAVLMATIPVFIALGEIAFLRTQRLTVRLIAALLMGVAGVGVLVAPGIHLGGTPVDRAGAVGLIVASISWAVASVSTRLLPLPESKTVSAATQMLVGGTMLSVLALATGEEWSAFHAARVSTAGWFSLLYLIVAGSLLGFTAYVWLIHRESPTRVGTYAYVNPVVAVMLGYFAGGEALSMQTVAGILLVLLSVVVITTAKSPKAAG